MKNILKRNSGILLATVVMLCAYMPTLQWMWDRWMSRDSYYSHGPLIPFVTIYLIWQLKDELIKIERKESKWALGLIIAGVGLHLVSAVLRIYFSSAYAMLLVFVGIILYFYGTEIFKKIAFPVLFLAFMLPLPEVVIINVSFKLKMFAAELATEALNGMRIPAIREGSLIKMAHAQVVVDDVCSGLRSLISLTALGSIFAYWLNGPFWKRVLVFSSTVPVAIFTNMIRVIFLSVVSEIWGAHHIEGFIHDASGFVVFGIAFIILYVINKVVE
ncbi:MAG: exosortase [Lysobacterales bacterium]|jgi:exosortase